MCRSSKRIESLIRRERVATDGGLPFCMSIGADAAASREGSCDDHRDKHGIYAEVSRSTPVLTYWVCANPDNDLSRHLICLASGNRTNVIVRVRELERATRQSKETQAQQ